MKKMVPVKRIHVPFSRNSQGKSMAYNGHLSGNMKVRLRRQKLIPLMCCNFNVKSIQRQEILSYLIDANSVQF